MAKSVEERFWEKVDKSGECWDWIASKNEWGYGQFYLNGRQRKSHRVSYEMANGPIPAGRGLDHICNRPGCVRPEHLRPVTVKQNNENLSGAYKTSKSGVRGVSWHKDMRKWQGQVGHFGKVYHVGYFDSIIEAETQVTAKRLELFSHNEIDKRAA